MPKDTGILGQGGGIAEINAVVRPNDAVFAVLFIQALGLIIGVAPVGAFQNRIVNVRPGHLQPGLDVGVLRLIVFDGSRHIGDGGGGFGGGLLGIIVYSDALGAGGSSGSGSCDSAGLFGRGNCGLLGSGDSGPGVFLIGIQVFGPVVVPVFLVVPILAVPSGCSRHSPLHSLLHRRNRDQMPWWVWKPLWPAPAAGTGSSYKIWYVFSGSCYGSAPFLLLPQLRRRFLMRQCVSRLMRPFIL